MKNTIIMQLADFLCPYSCISCGEVGKVLCGCCEKYITMSHVDNCLTCGGELINNVCGSCSLPFNQQFCLGPREGLLKKMIEIYKYNSVRVCGSHLA